MDRDTGAVWFTIKARPSNPNKPINDYDCIIPVEKAVISALAAVAPGRESALSEIAVEWGAKFVVGKVVGKVAQKAYNLVAGNSMAKKYGAYAGAPWPFRCTRKPEYTITGGPVFKPLTLGSTELYDAGTKMKIEKTGGC